MPTPRELWADALESERFKQGRGRLTRVKEDGTQEQCCLGVGCILFNEQHPEDPMKVVIEGPLTSFEDGDGRVYYDGQDLTLPARVQEWLGLRREDGLYGPPGDPDDASLASDNDSGQDFARIAATIRKAPEGLFAS